MINSFSLARHVNVFEQDLCQLFEKLKQLVFLNIYGKIDDEKVEPYRSIVQKCFPNSITEVEMSRFRLWI
jgi:hypothetical protein